MGWDGAGSYTRNFNFSADASSGIKILAARMDAELDDFASAMTIALARNGQNVPTQNLPMGGFRHINVGAPVSVNNYMRSREFIENIPVFMDDTASSADRISVSAQYFTSVSANQAPGDGTRILVRALSDKSSAALYLNGHSANVEFQDGNRAAAAMVSGGIYEMLYSSVDAAWKVTRPDDGRTAGEIAAGVTPTSYRYPEGVFNRYGTNSTPGTTDMTAAIQAAVNVMAQGGATPRGLAQTYLISNYISIPGAAGWSIVGDSRLTTTIVQATNNTPIFRFATEIASGVGPHSWRIADMKLSYSSAQSTSDTAACPIYFVGGASAPSFFNFVLERLNFDNCYSCVGADEGTNFTAWGGSFRDWTVQGTVSKSLIRLVPSGSSGQPNHRLDHIYALCMVLNGPAFYIKSAEECTMDCIELNRCSLGPQLIFDQSGGQYQIGAMRVELGDYTAATPMFDLTNSQAKIGQLLISIDTMNAAVGSLPYVFVTSGAYGHFDVDNFGLLITTVSGGTYYVSGAGGAGDGEVVIRRLANALPSNVLLTNIGSTASADGTRVETWNNGRVSGNKGDADYTVTIGDPCIVRYDTTLTATRVVTVPTPSAAGNMFNGLRYKVVRTGGGAFALEIRDVATNLITSIPSGQTGEMEVTYYRLGWSVTQYRAA